MSTTPCRGRVHSRRATRWCLCEAVGAASSLLQRLLIHTGDAARSASDVNLAETLQSDRTPDRSPFLWR